MDSLNKIVIESIIEFEKKSNELIKKLENEFELNLKEANPFDKLITRKNNLWKGKLKDNWTYWFHGDACEFENSLTKQFAYVKINRNGNYGVIDNFYLYKFIQTTKSLENVITKINTEKYFNEIISELEKEKIIINTDNNSFIETRILNSKIKTRF
jgi:hypothetical protein